MAKSSRSSVRKTNNAKLKSRVFGPVEAARTQRLSARLLELASQSKPPRTEMEVEKDSKEQSNTEAAESEPAAEAMDVDGARGATEDKPSKTALKKRAERTHNRHRKPANNIAFPKYHKGKKGSAGITQKGKR